MNEWGRAARWGKAVAVAVAGGLTVPLAACAPSPGLIPTPTVASPSVTAAPSPARPSSPTASGSPSSTAPGTPSANAAVRAAGSLALYGEVSTKLTGTCQVVDGVPTLTLADHDNEFFGTVDLVIELNPGREAVASLTADLGEDFELIKRRITYDAVKPAKGTSAKLAVSGNTYRLSGKARNVEDGTDAGTIPFAITARCANADW